MMSLTTQLPVTPCSTKHKSHKPVYDALNAIQALSTRLKKLLSIHDSSFGSDRHERGKVILVSENRQNLEKDSLQMDHPLSQQVP